MASKWLNKDPFTPNRSGVDLTHNYINIDRLCDVLVTTQKKNSDSVSFRQRKYEDDIDDIKQPKPKKENKCHGCTDQCHSEDNTQNRNRFIGLLEDDTDDDDEDDFYLCDYCDAIGYRQRYDASRCDSCSVCESCEEFNNDECSGCSYSVYRDGTYYRDRVNVDDLVDSEDNEVFKKLASGDVSSERLDASRFSLLD